MRIRYLGHVRCLIVCKQWNYNVLIRLVLGKKATLDRISGNSRRKRGLSRRDDAGLAKVTREIGSIWISEGRIIVKYIIKYNLYILSVYTLIMIGVLIAYWGSFSMLQRFTIGFLGLVTLHEWEETKIPGGFFKVMGGIMNVNMSKVPEGLLHLSPAVYIVVLTLLPLLFPGVVGFFLAVMYLGVFEGIIHIVGIKLGRLKKPYTPGMVTAEVMLIYSIVGIFFAVSKGLVAPLDWLLALVVFIGGFLLMEVGMYRILDLKFVDVMKRMKANIKGMRE